MLKVKFKKLADDVKLPVKGSSQAACFDVYAHRIISEATGKVTVKLGFATEIPEGYKGVIVPRSNLTKHHWVMNNSMGVIDADYRGEWMVVFGPTSLNFGFTYVTGDRVAQIYFDLQRADDGVRIGQESVRASLVSLRDARARFQAGVATKLEVLEAETQLARDQQLLTNGLADQSVARRKLARLLDLPQNVSPTAKEPLRPLGVWTPSLQESVIAAYAFREELDNALLDISAANSQANSALGSVQPFLSIFNNLSGVRYQGIENVLVDLKGRSGWAVENSVGLQATWNIFDGGAARAQYRQAKQRAQENSFRFASTRDNLRFEVEESFYQLRQANRNIQTTSREVISSRESLRLARLRFQAGLRTQREVVDNQRDLTQAEVRYANALAEYNNNLALLRRRTGLDQVAVCQPASLSGTKPVLDDVENVPVPPEPLQPACQVAAAAQPSS